MPGPGNMLCRFAGQQQTIAAHRLHRFHQRAIHPEGCVQLAGFAGRDAQHNRLIGGGGKCGAFKFHIRHAVVRRRHRGCKVQFAAILRYRPGVSAIHMQAADRLVGLGKQALHLAAELVGQVIVLLLQDRLAYGGQIILRVKIITVDRKARPECVLIQLQRFFRGIGGNGTRALIGLRVFVDPWGRSRLRQRPSLPDARCQWAKRQPTGMLVWCTTA